MAVSKEIEITNTGFTTNLGINAISDQLYSKQTGYTSNILNKQ